MAVAQAGEVVRGFSRGLRPVAKALPGHGRAHNRSLLMQTLFRDGSMSRADLSRRTALTRVTVSDLVAELIADGLLIERGLQGNPGPGKPATLVDLNHAGHCTVGLDLSGSDTLRGAVLGLDGDVLIRHHLPVPADPAAIVGSAISFARELVARAPAPVLGVGVGSPGVIDDRGVVHTTANFGWTVVDLRGILSAAVDVPVWVVNDADAAIRAEYAFGDGHDDLLLVRVGRGIGSALLSGGLGLRGRGFAAGEIGHVTVGTDGGPMCGCGRVGCLEAWVSVPALTGHPPEDRDRILRDAGVRLGIALAPVVGMLDLSEVVLSGPHDLLSGELRRATADTLRERTLLSDRLRVRVSAQGEDIVLRGAAMMVLSERLGVS
ncbi:ROK family protein [Microbacterium sp.]|uniref:ROK family transcriptional regulator n=1 Tax=Microbacterium sp. TaxID=51671 RepID=UPI003A84F102